MKAKFLLLVAALALMASAAFAVDVAPDVTSPVPEMSVAVGDTAVVSLTASVIPPVETSGTVEVVVPVSSYVEKRHELDSRDLAYLATVPEFDGIRERVRQLMVADMHHRPPGGIWISGSGAHTDPMFQTWTGPLQARVRIPAPRVEVKYVEKPLPPLGELQIVHTEPLRLQPVTLDLMPVGKAAPCVQPVPCAAAPASGGSLVISRSGGSDEHPVGSVWGTVERRQPVQKVCPPGPRPPGPPPPPTPPGPYCPPGGGTGITPPATPDPGNVHDPSQPGQNEPPISDPNQPPGQSHGTPGQSWEPFPDGPHQADPVNPPAGGGT